MTCKECLHYGICYTQETCNDIEQQLKDFGCKDFANRSEWVHLPCRVGDKVYRLSKCLGVVQFVITSFTIYQSEMFFTDDSDNIIYLPDIGRTVFLTREEAEKALNVLNK